MKRKIPTLIDGRQNYETYTAEDLWVWRTLFERQLSELEKHATTSYLEGLKKLNFSPGEIPEFTKINQYLKEINGWQVTAVEGIIADDLFFSMLAKKKFPATTWLRKPSELDYLEEPDMFHDVFGHVPILSDIAFTEFLEALGLIGVRFGDDPLMIHMLSRIYWYTVEFGLIRDLNGLKIYGAGILSSIAETKKSIAKETSRSKFVIGDVMNAEYHKDMMQDNYFVLESFDQLFQSLRSVEMVLLKSRLPNEFHKA